MRPETLATQALHTIGTPTPPGLLRLSVGLEHEADLLDDLVTALS